VLTEVPLTFTVTKYLFSGDENSFNRMKYLSIKLLLLSITINFAYAKGIDVKEYCNYKQSANHISVNLPITLRYKDEAFEKYIFISCSKGHYCSGFISSGAIVGTQIFEKIEVKHMGKDSVLLAIGINEFLLDIKNKIFRWTENTVSGGVAEYKCSKILSE
jgi:hypothetical protein